MIIGLGIDIIENSRVSKRLNNEFINTILTEKEKEIYISRKSRKQLEFLSGRIAAKEAIIKAISDFENPHMLELEISNNEKGKPYINFKNYNILISISHEKNYTVAEAILIKNYI